MSTDTQGLNLIYDDYKNCTRCPLHECRQNVVFGTGNPNAGILMVTDTPDELEDIVGNHNTANIRWLMRVFRGALSLNMSLQECAELFFQNVFITSAVICRPKAPTGDYRDPGWKNEIKVCNERLLSVIYEVDPNIIIGAGKFANTALLRRVSKLPRRSGVTKVMYTMEVPGEAISVPYSVIPTNDPTFAKRQGDYDDPNGFISSLGKALRTAWDINNLIEEEDQ